MVEYLPGKRSSGDGTFAGEVSKGPWNNLVDAHEILGTQVSWTARSTPYSGTKPKVFYGDFSASVLPPLGLPPRPVALSGWYFPRLPSRRRACEARTADSRVNRSAGEVPEIKRGKCTDYNQTTKRLSKEDKAEVKEEEFIITGNYLVAVLMHA